MTTTSITISQFMRVLNIDWLDALWGLFWMSLGIAIYTFIIIGSTTIRARQTFIKNELPKVHENKLQKEYDKNKILKMEIEILKDEKETILKQKEELVLRLDMIKMHYEEGLKGEK